MAAIVVVHSADLKVDLKGALQVEMLDAPLVVVTVACWAVTSVLLMVY